jgi:LysM repeat protein
MPLSQAEYPRPQPEQFVQPRPEPDLVPATQPRGELVIPLPANEVVAEPTAPPAGLQTDAAAIETTSLPPVVSPPAEPVRPAARTHIVAPGESFARLAQQYYGSQAKKYVDLLIRSNPDVDPRRMKVGTEVTIPPVDAPAATPVDADRPAEVVLPRMYRVQKGDTLYGIAKRLTGSGQGARELHRLNRDVIGDDPGNLRPGQVLKLPADWPELQE